MIRATITITGDVQETGYRAFVRDTARKLGLVGFIESLPDGRLKVVCEGEKERIENLIDIIKIGNEITEVEDMYVKYENSTGEYKGKGFTVKIEKSFRGLAQEIFWGNVSLSKLADKYSNNKKEGYP
ncbi:MAG: acylphosphatase [Thermoplasmatales archaeon]|nr:acylphosphatase [Thermoplasmatales archaeon]